MNFTFKAILQTCSPLHIAHPDNLRMDSNGQRNYSGDGFPCTAVQKMTIVLPETEPTDGELTPATRNSRTYPVIAANNIAGRMRRHAAEIVLTALVAKGQKVSMHAYTVLTCGASTGKPDSDDLSYEEYKAARQHSYFGLFGGGPKMFNRKIRVHNSLPITPLLSSAKGHFAHPDASSSALSDKTNFTNLWGFRRLDDLRDLANIEVAEASVNDFEKQFVARQALILADKDAEKSSRTSTKTYSAIEFVNPGVLFDLTMELAVKTEAQVGLYLETLDSFAKDERVGGYVRNGFGVINLLNVVMINTDTGETHSIFNNGRLERNHPVIAPFIEAWHVDAEQLDTETLERIIAVSKKDEKKAIKKELADAGA